MERKVLKDDVLLFFNDLHLKKVKITNQIVKTECKLFNSDNMHIASLYLDL
jgi:hypothetical protein